jgi:hypothetical protein
MPYFKCVACKTRLYSAASRNDPVGDLCPGCGSLLEPVGEPAEVFGFQSIRSRARPADGGASGTHERIAESFGGFIARREAFLALARLDAERWLDDGSSFRPERVRLARLTPERHGAGTTTHPRSPGLEG